MIDGIVVNSCFNGFYMEKKITIILVELTDIISILGQLLTQAFIQCGYVINVALTDTQYYIMY